jgi:hypothetical protein
MLGGHGLVYGQLSSMNEPLLNKYKKQNLNAYATGKEYELSNLTRDNKKVRTFTYIVTHVRCSPEFDLLNIKFHENPFSRSGVITCLQTDEQSDFNRLSTEMRTRL